MAKPLPAQHGRGGGRGRKPYMPSPFLNSLPVLLVVVVFVFDADDQLEHLLGQHITVRSVVLQGAAPSEGLQVGMPL